jgi:hypothetical protein
MQPNAPDRPGPNRLLRRYAPIVVVVVVVAIVAVVLGTRSGGGGGKTNVTTKPAANGEPPLFDSHSKTNWGPSCDTRTGRVAVPLLYAPPCVPLFNGDNGGATAPGVTKDTITIAVYETQPDPLQQAFFEQSRADEDVKKEEATQQAYADFFQSHYETYGRKIKLVFVKGSGGDSDDNAAKADAIKVATQIHAFASWGGPAMTSAYADELAARHVLCIADCLLAEPQKFVDDRAPYIWPTEPSFEQDSIHWSEFIAKELAGRNADRAGDPAMQSKPRRFGVLRYDDGQGTFAGTVKSVKDRLLAYKVPLTADVSYSFDLNRAAEEARNVIAQLKAAGVSSVLLAADPVMPTFFTGEATKQGFFPEWIVLGTVFTDTTLFGRNYDQKQWAHAFGVSFLPARGATGTDDLANVLTWQTGKPPAAKTYKLLVQAPLIFFTGLHLAGPHLSPETFRDGLFRYPAATTGPTHLHFSWGRHGIWAGTDYFGGDDAALIWWDPNAVGPDELGYVDKGMYQYSYMGKRFLPGQWPRGNPDVFNPATSVSVFSSLPPADRPPSYPPPPH